MKRFDKLAPLSRERQMMLILAQVLKTDTPDYKGLPTDIIGKQRYSQKLFHELILPHFQFEEQELFPAVSGIHHEIDQLIYILIDDHAEIARQIELMEGDTKIALGSEQSLNDLGVSIEGHIRLEEREFFELVQRHVDETLLPDFG
jgi:iron-sulfur cluster repair protein YtfE (RIC family)